MKVIGVIGVMKVIRLNGLTMLIKLTGELFNNAAN